MRQRSVYRLMNVSQWLTTATENEVADALKSLELRSDGTEREQFQRLMRRLYGKYVISDFAANYAYTDESELKVHRDQQRVKYISRLGLQIESPDCSRGLRGSTIVCEQGSWVTRTTATTTVTSSCRIFTSRCVTTASTPTRDPKSTTPPLGGIIAQIQSAPVFATTSSSPADRYLEFSLPFCSGSTTIVTSATTTTTLASAPATTPRGNLSSGAGAAGRSETLAFLPTSAADDDKERGRHQFTREPFLSSTLGVRAAGDTQHNPAVAARGTRQGAQIVLVQRPMLDDKSLSSGADDNRKRGRRQFSEEPLAPKIQADVLCSCPEEPMASHPDQQETYHQRVDQGYFCPSAHVMCYGGTFPINNLKSAMCMLWLSCPVRRVTRTKIIRHRRKHSGWGKHMSKLKYTYSTVVRRSIRMSPAHWDVFTQRGSTLPRSGAPRRRRGRPPRRKKISSPVKRVKIKKKEEIDREEREERLYGSLQCTCSRVQRLDSY